MIFIFPSMIFKVLAYVLTREESKLIFSYQRTPLIIPSVGIQKGQSILNTVLWVWQPIV